MNKLEGTIKDIQVSGSMSLVQIDMGNDVLLKTIVIETPDTGHYLREDHPVKVLFKETEVVIGIGEHNQVSLQNKIPAEIVTIEKGALISKLKLNSNIGNLTAVISTNAVNELDLAVGNSVFALIKLNEVMLSA